MKTGEDNQLLFLWDFKLVLKGLGIAGINQIDLKAGGGEDRNG